MELNSTINDLITKLLTNGSAEFSQDGINVTAEYNNGQLVLSATYESPKEDNTELIKNFETFVQGLDDELFLEIVETFENGELKAIQDKLDSGCTDLVKKGISKFMEHLSDVVKTKIKNLSLRIKDLNEALIQAYTIRNSYADLLEVEF